jgi:predicted Fe-S protein YdhL (DUF1289 family)
MKAVLVTSILQLGFDSVSRNRKITLGKVPSPCIQVCRIQHGYCAGCKRTIDEIREWSIMSEYEQQKLLLELKWRKDVRDTNH